LNALGFDFQAMLMVIVGQMLWTTAGVAGSRTAAGAKILFTIRPLGCPPPTQVPHVYRNGKSKKKESVRSDGGCGPIISESKLAYFIIFLFSVQQLYRSCSQRTCVHGTIIITVINHNNNLSQA
jgi:hypothetical protein